MFSLFIAHLLVVSQLVTDLDQINQTRAQNSLSAAGLWTESSHVNDHKAAERQKRRSGKSTDKFGQNPYDQNYAQRQAATAALPPHKF